MKKVSTSIVLDLVKVKSKLQVDSTHLDELSKLIWEYRAKTQKRTAGTTYRTANEELGLFSNANCLQH